MGEQVRSEARGEREVMDISSGVALMTGGLTIASVIYGAGRIHQSLNDLGKSVEDMRVAMFNGGTGVVSRLTDVEKRVGVVERVCEERHRVETLG